jgi:hypothetical protein
MQGRVHMPSRLTTIAQIALITLFVALVGISSWYSSHGPPNTVSLPGRSNIFFQWLTHDAAGFFALWLVIIGGIQLAMFWRQLRLIRESLVDAKQAADAATQGAKAAETNAQALIDAESAQVYVVILESNISHIFKMAGFYDNTPSMESGNSDAPWIEYRLKNYGKSPAIIRQVEADARIKLAGMPFDLWSPPGAVSSSFAPASMGGRPTGRLSRYPILS